MKRLKLFLSACALMISAIAYAQTDVTSTYLTNADFEGEYTVFQNLNSGSNARAIYKPEGWTVEYGNSDSNDITALNSDCLQWNNFSSRPQPTNGGNKTYWIRFRWGNSETLTLSQTVTLPAGKYCFSADAFFNGASGASAKISANSNSTTITGNSTWSNYEVNFVLASETSVTFSFNVKQTSTIENIAAFDNFKLTYTAVVIKDILQTALTAATNANATLNNSDLSAAIASAQGVYDDANATQEEVNSAAAILNAATESAMSAAGDVTGIFLTSPGFESCTETTTNAAAGGSAAPNDISGDWTQSSSAAWSSSAVVAYGGSGQVNGASAPSTDNAGNTGKALGISVGWDGLVTYQSAAVTLPAGIYTLKVYGYNALSGVTQFASKFGFVPTSGTSTISTKKSFAYGTWEEDKVTFTLNEATEGKIQIGGQAVSGGSGSNAKVFFDNITIAYSNPLMASKDALQAEIDKAKLCDAKEGLADVIATAEGVLVSATTVAELEEALAALQAADKDAVLRYENGLADATAMAPVVTNFVVNGTFDDSDISMWSCNTSFQNRGRKTTDDGGAGNMNSSKPWWENWNGSALINKMSQTISNIPNGTYRLDITAFVNNFNAETQYVFANSAQTALTDAARSGATYEVYTVVTNNQIEVGFEQTAATANWMGIDNVSLRYYGAGDVINDAKNAGHKLAWEEAKAAAEAAIANDDYENVTGSELTALQAEIAKDEPSTADGYDEATTALTTATAAFTAAKGVYDAYAEIHGVAVTLSVASGDAPADADAAVTATHALNVAVYNATTADNIFDVTEVYNPSWSSMGTSSGQHWSGDTSISYADEWRGDTNPTERTATITLPAGEYILMSAGRGSDNTVTTMSANGTTVTFASNGDMGIGINKAGAASFDADDAAGFANKSGAAENTGTGWEWRYIPVTLTEETAVTVTQTLTRLSGSAWGSFCDFKILKVGVVADADDYAALNSAIETAEAKTLGFEEGQYAPYNNVAALEALAAAKAFDQTATNEKETVEAVTASLTSATWTPNDEDVDAIFNGMYATVAAGANYPDGWTRTNGWGQMRSEIEGNFETAYYNQPGSLQYGNQGVYTMPLAANTAYQLTFSYRSHENNSNNGVTVSVLNGEDGMPAATFTKNGSTSDWADATAYFTTGAAGNYVLTLANSGNTWMTNVSLVKFEHAASIDLDEEKGLYRDFDRTYAKTVTVERTVKDGFNTVCMPFDLTAEQVADVFGDQATVYEFSENSADANDVTINFNQKSENTIAANVPVLIGNATASTEKKTFNNVMFMSGEAKVAGTNFDFVGTYEGSTTIEENDYFIGNGAIYKSAGSTDINAFRAYLDNKGGANVEARIFIEGVETTGINEVIGKMSEVRDGSFYDLQGRKVANPSRGLYIINGHKVVIK